MKQLSIHVLALVFASTGLVAPAPAASTINSVNKFAYGANLGWINTEGNVTHGVVVGELACSGFAYGANVGWIGFGTGPADGYQYANLSASDYGVNLKPDGALRGFAYGANIGWITFEDNGDPRVNLLDGTFSGSAYGANVGWISLSNLFAVVQTDSLDPGPDTDGDMLPDAWERGYAANLDVLGTPGDDDEDNDGASDKDEYLAGTDPTDGDSLLAITELLPGPSDTHARLSWQSVETRLYEVHFNGMLTNPAGWIDALPALHVPDAGGLTSRMVPIGGPAFENYRINAIRPLAP